MCQQKMPLSSNNLDLAYKIASKICNLYSSWPLEKEELCGALFETLVRAEHTFDPSRGVKFSTYAWTCLWHEGLRWAKEEMRYQSTFKQKDNLEGEEGDPPPLFPSPNGETAIYLYWILETSTLIIRTKKQRRIIEEFLQDPALTGREIAHRVGTSQEYANHIIRKFKLRGQGRGGNLPS